MITIDLTKEKEGVNIHFTGNVIYAKDGGGDKNYATKEYVEEEIKKIEIPNTDNLETKDEAQNKLKEAKSYTDNEIKKVVGNAPESLNTLNKLASATNTNKESIKSLDSAVRNKVDKSYVDENFQPKGDYATKGEVNNVTQTIVQLGKDVSKKVDKIDGKGLSTEDFTTILKQKLESLKNFDSSEIENSISQLQTQINTLVSGNASTAIESFNEIIAFLEGIEDSEDLSSIIASIEQSIAKKADASSLAKVAKTGSYNDLKNRPTIPTSLSELSDDEVHRLVTDEEKQSWNSKSDFSGSYDDLQNKPTIPNAVTESTVSGWGFTKNTGNYNKPSSGIPKSDLASDVQTSLGKADTALQEEQYKGTVTGVKMNGTTKNPSNGVVDLGTVITAHQDISGKQDTLVSGSNIKTINGNSIVGSGNVNVSVTEANIINNLTTGGEADALSAEQGKVLKETIDGLQVDVKDRFSLLEGFAYEMDKKLNNDGTLQNATSGLGVRVFDYVPVVKGTYICCCRSYCTYDSNKTKITCDISGQETYGKFYTITMPQNGYIRICAASTAEYIRLCLESEKYKTRADYHGIQNLYNPITSPCNVVLLGDSNTYGYGLTDRTKAWSGFYNSAITNLPQNVFCDVKVFTSYFVSQSYQNTIKMGAFGKVYFKVYTDFLSLKFEYVGTVNITIDGIAQTAITTSNPSYELAEGLHEVVLEAASGNNNIFYGFAYHQLRTCVNNAVSGTKSSSLANVDIALGNLFVVMFGTNDRELNYGETMNNLSSFIMKCKDAGKKVVILSPLPPLQETHSSYKINIGQVVSQFANDIKPLVKYIDVYSIMEMYYLIFTKLHNTAIYSDYLHLNELGHRLLWSAIAPKLGFAMHISDLIAE